VGMASPDTIINFAELDARNRRWTGNLLIQQLSTDHVTSTVGAPRLESSTERGRGTANRGCSQGQGRSYHLNDVNGLSALPAAIYMTDAEGRLAFYNEAAAELWGCRPELGESTFCGCWKRYSPDGTPPATCTRWHWHCVKSVPSVVWKR
jgi:PAS domain-containing protein